MTKTILRTVPCWACGHRIGPDAGQCPYCGQAPRRKRYAAPTAPLTVARAVGRCASCGGRMQRERSLVARLLARLGWRPRALQGKRLVCTSCGQLERAH